MTMVTIARFAAMSGFLAAMVLMVWVLIGLARLRRHPDFRSHFSGSLRLHLMLLGASTTHLDAATRRQIGALRLCVLAALALFVAAVVVVMLIGVGGALPG